MFEMSRSYKGKKNISESLRELLDHMPILDEGCFNFKVADVENILGRLKTIGYLNDRFSRESVIIEKGLSSVKVISMLKDKDSARFNHENLGMNKNNMNKSKNYNGIKRQAGGQKVKIKDLKNKIKTALRYIPNLITADIKVRQFSDLEKKNLLVEQFTGLSSSEWSLLKNELAINSDEIDDSMATFVNSYTFFQKVAI